MKHRFALALVVSLFCAACTPGPREVSLDMTVPTGEKGTVVQLDDPAWKRFTTPDGGFSIDFPSDWQLNDSSGADVFGFMPAGEDAGITFLIADLQGKVFERFVAADYAQIPGGDASFECEKIQQVLVAGVDGYRGSCAADGDVHHILYLSNGVHAYIAGYQPASPHAATVNQMLARVSLYTEQ